jgi:hypothetical protein
MDMDRMTRVSVRDFAILQLKLLIDRLEDGALFTVSFVAFATDVVLRRRGRRWSFYKVMRISERFDLWLNLYGAADGAERDETAFSDGVRREATQCLVTSSRFFEGPMNRLPRTVMPNRDNPSALPSGSWVQLDAPPTGGSSPPSPRVS